jgi:ankyrin repeat protein
MTPNAEDKDLADTGALALTPEQRKEFRRSKRLLFRALRRGDAKSASKIVEELPEPWRREAIEGRDTAGNDALSLAAASNCFEWIEREAPSAARLNASRQIDLELRQVPRNGESWRIARIQATPLVAAARSGSPLAVAAMLRLGADPNAPGGERESEIAPLGAAFLANAGDGCAESARLLIEAGADVWALDTNGERPAHQAARAKDPACSRLLASEEQGRATNDQGKTPLIVAAERGWAEPLRVWLTVSNPFSTDTHHDQTALEWACGELNAECAATLARAMAAARPERDDRQWADNALRVACGAAHWGEGPGADAGLSIVRELLSLGADPLGEDALVGLAPESRKESTPLMAAVKGFANPALVSELVDAAVQRDAERLRAALPRALATACRNGWEEGTGALLLAWTGTADKARAGLAEFGRADWLSGGGEVAKAISALEERELAGSLSEKAGRGAAPGPKRM